MSKLPSKVASLILIVLSISTDFIASAEEGKERENHPNAVAVVNGRPILFSSFQEELKKAERSLGHGEFSPQRMEEISKEVLDQMIARELVLQEAKKEKIDPDLLVKKEIYEKSAVTAEELQVYYQNHPGEFMKPEGVRLRHLLVRVDPSSRNEGWKGGYQKALELSRRANQGEDFDSLIQNYSDPEATYFGGDLKVQYKGQMAMTEFEPAAFSLREKEVSLPIQTLYGFSLIKVVEKILPKPLSFSEINQEKLKKKLSQEKAARRSGEWLLELRRQADIKFNQE